MKKIIYTLFILCLLISCSTKKSGITNRTYHRITSWYNTVFNGNETLDKELKVKEQSYEDNFSKIIKVEPIDPFVEDGLDSYIANMGNQQSFDNTGGGSLNNRVGKVFNDISTLGQGSDQSQAQGLDRVIEKGQKAIENHSMLIKGKEYNSMLGEAYLMLARAHYYKRESFDAINYLNYMNSTLVKNRKENQANVYLALAQAQAGNSFEANEIYEKILNSDMKKRDIKFAMRAYSQFLIDQERYKEGIAALEVSKRYNKTKYERGRYNFIQGQLSEKLGKEENAADYYQTAYNKKPSPELEIKSQIALSRLFKGDTLKYRDRVKFLKKLTKNGLYQSRKNELYYAMAVTSLKVKKEKDAMEFLNQSLKEKESDPQVRALAYQAVGDIYFSRPDYIYAGAYYDSAISRFIDPDMKTRLSAKNNSLKEVIKKYYLVKKNDSILAVAKMTPDERNQYFQKHIDKLKVEEEKVRRELEKQMDEANNTVFATETLDGNASFTSLSTSNSGKWYFYNTSLKQNGQSEFKNIWGNRSLSDNWRMSKRSSSLDDMKNELLGQNEVKNPRRFEVEYYTEKIPAQAELEALKKERDSAELTLGILYYDKLHDVKSATTSLEHLISTPPFDESISMAAMYNIFRFNKESNAEISKKYGDMVTTRYPNSKYAESILNPDIDIFKTKSSAAVLAYEEAYKKYEEGKYAEVKASAAKALETYPTDEIIAKFSLLSAFCDARLGNKEAFMEGLERVSIVFENKEEGKKAAELLAYFKEQEKQKTAPVNPVSPASPQIKNENGAPQSIGNQNQVIQNQNTMQQEQEMSDEVILDSPSFRRR